MPVWAQILTQIFLTAFAVTAVLFAFWFWVVKPWLAERIQDLIDTANEIEPKVTSGVQKGVAESIRQIPQSAWDGATRESTRQFLKFGSNLFENGPWPDFQNCHRSMFSKVPAFDKGCKLPCGA